MSAIDHHEVFIVFSFDKLHLKQHWEIRHEITTYRARVVTNSTETYGCVPVGHTRTRIVFHDLILHQSELLGHFHRLSLVMQHAIAHLIDDLLATFDVVLGSGYIRCQ